METAEQHLGVAYDFLIAAVGTKNEELFRNLALAAESLDKARSIDPQATLVVHQGGNKYAKFTLHDLAYRALSYEAFAYSKSPAPEHQRRAIDALEKANKYHLQASTYAKIAECYLRLNERQNAYAALYAGQNLDPTNIEIKGLVFQMGNDEALGKKPETVPFGQWMLWITIAFGFFAAMNLISVAHGYGPLSFILMIGCAAISIWSYAKHQEWVRITDKIIDEGLKRQAERGEL